MDLRVVDVGENVPADVISHFTVVQADNFHFLKFIYHIDDTFCHILWQLIVAEIEGKEILYSANGLNNVP